MAESAETSSAYEQGLDAFHKEDYSTAVDFLNQAVTADPEHALSHFYLGLAYNRLNRLTEATGSLEKALTLNPGLPGLHLNLGIIYYKRNYYERALTELNIAVAEDSSNGTAFFFKGLTEQRLRDFTASIESFQQAQTLNPEYQQNALYFQGIAHYYNDHLEPARDALTRSIEIDSQSENAEKARAVLKRIESGKPAEKDFNISFGVGFLFDNNLTSFEQDLVSEVDDVAGTFEVDADYKLFQTHGYTGTVSYNFYQSLYAEVDDFNLSSHILGFSVNKETEQWDYGFNVLGGHNMLGGESFIQNYSLIPSLGYSWSDQFYTRLHYHLQFKNFQQAVFDDRDGNNNSIGADQFYFMKKGQVRAQIGYRFMVENTDAGRFDYQGHNLSASLKGPIPYLGDFLLRYNYLDKNFTKVTPFINAERRDKVHTVQATLTRPLAYGLSFKLDYQYLRSKSNFFVVDYNKSVVTLGLSYTY